MSGTNQILQFAGGGGANVLTPAAYAALSSLVANGFSAGIAPSQQLNTVWRQSSFVATMIAQYIANLTGQNVNDDGNLATLLTNFELAINQGAPNAGSILNGRMSITAASATGVYTADEVVLESALGGAAVKYSSVNTTFNLATDMDTGVAPVSGNVALYLTFNPTTQAYGRLIQNASALVGNVYSGAHMTAGYVHSALVGFAATTSGSLMAICELEDRKVQFADLTVLTTSSNATAASLSIASAVPLNAKRCSGAINGNNNTVNTGNVISIGSTSSMIGAKERTFVSPQANANDKFPFEDLMLITPQTIFYSTNPNTGTLTTTIFINGYTF